LLLVWGRKGTSLTNGCGQGEEHSRPRELRVLEDNANFAFPTQLILIFLAFLLFVLYTAPIPNNPPGFYLDEASIAYNAYSLSQSGASEFGVHWPLYFQFEAKNPSNLYGPTFVYLLAGIFYVVPPSITAARLVSALLVFAAGVLMGILGLHISRRGSVAFILGVSTLLTPWLFEISRMAHEVTPYPLEIVLLLIVIYKLHARSPWSLLDCSLLAGILALLTYTYAIGRLLGPLFAFGLVLFASDQRRLISVAKTWILYGISLVPLVLFHIHHPGLLQKRFTYLTYIERGEPLPHILSAFARHYILNLNPVDLLLKGDPNPRHHVPGATGSILVAVFITALAGIFTILVRYRHDPWWRFVLFGTAVSILPGALTFDIMHTLRLIAFPIFLLILMVPAIEWMLPRKQWEQRCPKFPYRIRQVIAAGLATLLIAQSAYFQFKFKTVGPTRGAWFEAAFPRVLAVATAMPNRPIYLISDSVRTNAFWYATVQKRDLSDFFPIEATTDEPNGEKPNLPLDSLVISSEANCLDCRIIFRGGRYLLYLSGK
jgi:hypothetical protein